MTTPYGALQFDLERARGIACTFEQENAELARRMGKIRAAADVERCTCEDDSLARCLACYVLDVLDGE